MKAGRFRGARAFLEQWRPTSEAERIERLFLLGQVELQLALPKRAAERFEEILTLQPSLTEIRLELARAYYLAGIDDKARYHFSLAQAGELPSSVDAVVDEFLRRIDARKRWSASVSASVLPETKRLERETIRIGGVPFRLDEDARGSSGAGALVSAGVSFSPRLTDDLRGVLGASAGAEFYRNSQWNDVTVSGRRRGGASVRRGKGVSGHSPRSTLDRGRWIQPHDGPVGQNALAAYRRDPARCEPECRIPEARHAA